MYIAATALGLSGLHYASITATPAKPPIHSAVIAPYVADPGYARKLRAIIQPTKLKTPPKNRPRTALVAKDTIVMMALRTLTSS